jgi:ABC-type antimicrobial peptide transport system permease subunit
MAIGATQGIVLRYFLARGLALAAVGIGVGGVASVVLSRFMSRVLFGVAATDLASFASALALVVTAAAVASFVPAWRGSRVDPAEALRHH